MIVYNSKSYVYLYYWIIYHDKIISNPIKKILIILLFIPFLCFSQKTETNKLKFDPNKKTLKVGASCGICMLNMKGKECLLAVKYKDESYYVDGAGIDDFGDAHSDTGFCNSISDAKIQGKLIDEIFFVSYFELIK